MYIWRACVALVAALAMIGMPPSGPTNANRVGAPVARYLVLIVLDGARPDYFGVTRLPHVDALRARGTQFTNAIDGILESETPAGHTALTTGSTPRRNGIFGFNWAQSDNDFSLFSATVIRSGAAERIMQRAHVPTLAGLYKAQFPRARVVALSGHKYYAADPLGGPKADAILYYAADTKGQYAPTSIPGHVPPAHVLTAHGLSTKNGPLPLGQEDHLASKLALAAFHVMRPRMTLMNVPEFDWPLGHVYGGKLDRAKLIALMRGFDTDLGRIEDAYRKAGILNQTLFVITSDHGMSPVKHFIPSTVFTHAIAAAGTTAPSIAYNHSAYIWLHNPSKARAVANNLVHTHTSGIQSVYYLVHTKTGMHYVRAPGAPIGAALEHANQYLLDTLMNGHEPNVIVICQADTTTSSSATRWKADHGGPTWPSEHIPLIIAGPGVNVGRVVSSPARLIDVAPTVLTAMGVQPRGMEGSVLAEALGNPSEALQHARSNELRALTPVVRALAAADK